LCTYQIFRLKLGLHIPFRPTWDIFAHNIGPCMSIGQGKLLTKKIKVYKQKKKSRYVFRAYLGLGWSLKHVAQNYIFISISQYYVQKCLVWCGPYAYDYWNEFLFRPVCTRDSDKLGLAIWINSLFQNQTIFCWCQVTRKIFLTSTVVISDP